MGEDIPMVHVKKPENGVVVLRLQGIVWRLIVRMDDGSEITREHGGGFDAWRKVDEIQESLKRA